MFFKKIYYVFMFFYVSYFFIKLLLRAQHRRIAPYLTCIYTTFKSYTSEIYTINLYSKLIAREIKHKLSYSFKYYKNYFIIFRYYFLSTTSNKLSINRGGTLYFSSVFPHLPPVNLFVAPPKLFLYIFFILPFLFI